jgi:hypothetical protein
MAFALAGDALTALTSAATIATNLHKTCTSIRDNTNPVDFLDDNTRQLITAANSEMEHLVNAANGTTGYSIPSFTPRDVTGVESIPEWVAGMADSFVRLQPWLTQVTAANFALRSCDKEHAENLSSNTDEVLPIDSTTMVGLAAQPGNENLQANVVFATDAAESIKTHLSTNRTDSAEDGGRLGKTYAKKLDEELLFLALAEDAINAIIDLSPKSQIVPANYSIAPGEDWVYADRADNVTSVIDQRSGVGSKFDGVTTDPGLRWDWSGSLDTIAYTNPDYNNYPAPSLSNAVIVMRDGDGNYLHNDGVTTQGFGPAHQIYDWSTETTVTCHANWADTVLAALTNGKKLVFMVIDTRTKTVDVSGTPTTITEVDVFRRTIVKTSDHLSAVSIPLQLSGEWRHSLYFELMNGPTIPAVIKPAASGLMINMSPPKTVGKYREGYTIPYTQVRSVDSTGAETPIPLGARYSKYWGTQPRQTPRSDPNAHVSSMWINKCKQFGDSVNRILYAFFNHQQTRLGNTGTGTDPWKVKWINILGFDPVALLPVHNWIFDDGPFNGFDSTKHDEILKQLASDLADASFLMRHDKKFAESLKALYID